MKVSCYRNYCIDFNQILNNDRDHQVVVVGGPNKRPTNPRWRTAAILKKKTLNRYISAIVWPILMKFGKMTQIGPYRGCTVKFLNFWKFKMAAAAILKITKIAISPQRFDRSLRNLVRWCIMGLLTALTVKNFKFHKSKRRTAAILKTVKSPYLCNRLTDFDEIRQDDALWAPTAERSLKFPIFKNSRWRQPPCWKSQKSRYIHNGLTDLYEIWYAGAKWVS